MELVCCGDCCVVGGAGTRGDPRTENASPSSSGIFTVELKKVVDDAPASDKAPRVDRVMPRLELNEELACP